MTGTRPSGEPITVLIIEDEEPILKMLQEVLTEEGYRAYEARDGAAGLEAIAEHSPAILILDLNLPVLDGASLLQRLRAEGTRIPTIVISASFRGSEIAAREGADTFLAKPFDIDDLLVHLARLVTSSGAHPSHRPPNDRRSRERTKPRTDEDA